MKKNIYIFSILACLCFSGCSNSKKDNINPDDYIMVVDAKGNSDYLIIYEENASLDIILAIEDFAIKMEQKTKVSFRAYKPDAIEQSKEIIIGNVQNRTQSAIFNNRMLPTAYAIKQTDEKILVGAMTEENLMKAIDTLYSSIIKYGKNKWGIKKGVEIFKDNYFETIAPRITDSIGETDGFYYAGNGNYEVGYKNSTLQDFDNYKTLLESEGFNKCFENSIGNNKYCTFAKDNFYINVSYYPNKQRLHMLYGTTSYLPNQEVKTSNNTNGTITHIKRNGSSQSSPGLSIVCQLTDGTYIIIDGGPEDVSDEVTLYNFLVKNNPLEGKPQITWMFTHAHHDHMGLAISFLENYKDKIDVNLFCYNFPDFDSITISKEPVSRIETSKELIAQFDTLKQKYYKDVPVYTFHAGDKLQLSDCEVEFLLTHETFWPNDFPWINHTSSAWTIKMDDTKMLVLGDCEQTVCEWMAEVYKQNLKADILQVTHHGLNGGSIPMYEYVDPDICLWAIDNQRFLYEPMCLGTKSGFEYNAWLRNTSIKERTHYAASYTTTINTKKETN